MMKMFARAAVFAAEAHRGATDKAGVPYIEHPLAVAEAVAHLGEVYATAAVLHDVVEDTYFDVADIEALFGADVAAAVDALTHRKTGPSGTESTADYYERVKANRVALVVKIADIAHNYGRLDNIECDVTRDRLTAKYEAGARELTEALAHFDG